MKTSSLDTEHLRKLYQEQGLSVSKIAQKLNASETNINYWMKKAGIPKRSISEAIYLKNNPLGDPFLIHSPETNAEFFLYGLGLGLYWGEGNKKNKNSIRLGNSDFRLVKKFLEFLETLFSVKKEQLRFGVQIFNDLDPKIVKKYWENKLDVSPEQFQKVIVTPTRGNGTYRAKAKHGVLTVYFHNTKLRNIICETIEKL